MNEEALRRAWREEESAAHMLGWDFSHIRGRYTEGDDLPWDYTSLACGLLRRDVSVHWPSLTLRERLLGGTATVLPAFLAVWMGLDTETLAQGAGILLAAVILGGCGGYFRRTGKRSLPALLPAGILAVFSAGWLGMYLWEHVQVFLRGEGSGEYAVCSCLALLFLMGGILLAGRGTAVRRQRRG